jgi:acetyl-CoA synthetase
MSSLDLTEAQIAVHWKEEGYLQPPKKFIEQANLKDPDVLKRFALDKFPKCFDE